MGKRVLVTGGNAGIGYFVAGQLAGHGAGPDLAAGQGFGCLARGTGGARPDAEVAKRLWDVSAELTGI